jgi:hypothetical protein
MRLPEVRGTIDRRILINYRVDPATIEPWVPKPFRPKLVRGWAIAGFCLIRLKNLRPWFLPVPWGMRSENAAHRIAVEWNEGGMQREGVFIPRRDTNSRFNTLVGGKLFPGEHHHARFELQETDNRLAVEVTSDDGAVRIGVSGRTADRIPDNSIFGSLSEASAFFQAGSLGYSATSNPLRCDGLQLVCDSWQVTPLVLDHLESSFFDNRTLFPDGSATFDCALLMRGIEHRWRRHADMCCMPNLQSSSRLVG